MLPPRTRLGPYEVVAQIGVGGMGEVYKAFDSNLKRAVAIKVLPASVARDWDRLVRFQREAEVLAALNHPNIAQIHGLEKSDGTIALVMELVEGPTLADRIALGAIPLDEAMPIAKQIAEALEAAHEQGIIHRDLKPANIKVREDGTVKVLDFGLAKAMEPAVGSSASHSMSPTITTPALTQAGVILGTAAYMSPEQAKGRPADKRSDVWSFGCVLYEMLTGRRAFGGPTMTETLAAILEREVDWTRLPASTPTGVRILLRRALTRDPKRRLRDIADARLELEDDLRAHTPASGPSHSTATLEWIAALCITAVAAGSAVWYFGANRPSSASPAAVTRLVVVPEGPFPTDAEGVVTLSPDGRRLAYVAAPAGRSQIYLRELDRFEARPVPGTEGATGLVFAPDGNSLAFSAAGRVKKIALTGGAPTTLLEADTEGSLSLSWESSDSLFFRPVRATGIWRLPATGGAPTAVTTLQPGEVSHVNPAILPGGNALLYVAGGGVFAQPLQGDQPRRRLTAGSFAQYLPTGHLVYVEGGTLFAVPFDTTRLELRGQPAAVLEGIRESQLGAAQLAFSDSGTMAYIPTDGAERRSDLVWVDRTGTEQATFATGLDFSRARLSPDGNRVVAAIGAGAGQGELLGNVWVFDLARETRTPITFDGRSTFPLWSPDGIRLAYSSGREGRYELYFKTLSGAGPDQVVPTNRGSNYPLAWSPDGRFIATITVDQTTANDIWVLPVGDPSQWRPFVQTRFGEGGPTFSPDGRWLAYASAKSGRTEVYMRPFPGPGEEVTLSTDGGNEPMWSRKTGELFYRQGDAMMVLDVATTPAVAVGQPRRLFEKQYNRTNGFWSNYDVSPDGQRLLMVKAAQEAPRHINVVLNWYEELKRLVPTN